MSAKQEVIAYLDDKFGTRAPLRDALLSMLRECEDEGRVRQLKTAYLGNDPAVAFTDSEEVSSGANYDYGTNTITIKPGGQALDLADNLIFESFNCAHREDYLALRTRFNQNTFPPMLFMDFGKEMARIEGTVTYEYVALLREIEKNKPVDPPFTAGAKRALQKNDEVRHESQLIARMHWTPHDPVGTGDWRFPTPEHYAFRKVMEMTPGQTVYRIKYLVVSAAGAGTLRDYAQMDLNMNFQRWVTTQWSRLQPTAKPTSFIAMCEEANRVFPAGRGRRWRPIALADYQFTTAMELEARRLQKRSALDRAPALAL